jgi:dTDP-L-rhamnose 4-epimerase
MGKRVLVTGGAGFIGSHVVDALVERGDDVTVLDALEPQVHGDVASAPGFRPDYLHPAVRLVVGGLEDRPRLVELLRDAEVVVHQAAAVGVGQSQYEIARYVRANVQSTAELLDAIATAGGIELDRLVVASSMSIYGEGLYAGGDGREFAPAPRPTSQLTARSWEMTAPDGSVARPLPTPETKPLVPTSVYALAKRDQEDYCLLVGDAYGVPTVALRYFNVYGARQALSNPYTGVAAIFGSCLLNGEPPTIFEDGRQTRDFTHVRDIVQANLLAIDADASAVAGEAFNVGTGTPTSLLGLYAAMSDALGTSIEPVVAGQFRSGDIRHCYADIGKIERALGYRPSVPFDVGVKDIVEWLTQQTAVNRTAAATAELRRHRLVI